MNITARVDSRPSGHEATVTTNGVITLVPIPAREGIPGSSLNGGELLFLALATCYGNDLYREARPRGLDVLRVEVQVEGEFGGVGEAARRIGYRVRVEAKATEAAIIDLIRHTDAVAEVQATLRQGMPVELTSFEAVSATDG